MNGIPAKGFVALTLSLGLLGAANAADPLPAQTRLAAAPSAAAATSLGFNIATPQDLVVTLTDLQVPAKLVSANVVIAQADAIAGTATLASPATSATVSILAANGDYTLYVFGVPDPGFSVGTFTVCVAPQASPSNCIQSASLSGSIAAQSTATDPTVSTFNANLAVTAAGAYKFTFQDFQFPVALRTPPSVALFQGATLVQGPIVSGSSLNLNAGTYRLLAIAQADQTTQAGLFGISVTGAGATPLDATVPIGLIDHAQPFLNSNAQTVSLTVTDYSFPGPLGSASALLTAGGTALGMANAAGGAVSFAAPAGDLELWTYAKAGATPGTFSADVSGATDLYTAAQGVQPPGSAYAYAFVSPPLTAGTYSASAADLQFPSQLNGLAFAVAQNGAILQQSAGAGSINIDAAAGKVILLASAQTPAAGSASGNGLFDVNLQTTDVSPQLVYDKTQAVSSSAALFDSQTLNLGVSANFDVSLKDLKFPAQFDNLALVVSQGSNVLGKIFGGGPFTFPASPGSYQLTFVATPAANQQFGLYGVSILFTPPTLSLTSSVSSAAPGTAVTLTWSANNASSCVASDGWSGSKATSSSEAVALAATTTYTLTCTGTGGTAAQSVTVTATTDPGSGGGGGGEVDVRLLALCLVLLSVRILRCTRIKTRLV